MSCYENNCVNLPKITVAIPTYNRAEFLDSCLKALLVQTVGLNNFCVMIIDNNSCDNTKSIINIYAQKFPYFVSYLAPIIGLSFAKNLAMNKCETQWIAYLDDDGKPRPNWLAEAYKVIEQNKCICFGGYYYPWLKYGPLPIWMPENFGTNDQGYTIAGPLPNKAYLSGGNCFYRIDILRQYGGFPINYGMKGNRIGYAEESVLLKYMEEGGQSIWIAPQVIIDHCVQKYKYSMLWNLKSMYSRGRDSFRCNYKIQGDHTTYLSRQFSYDILKVCILCVKNFSIILKRKPIIKALYMYLSLIAFNFGYFIGKYNSKT